MSSVSSMNQVPTTTQTKTKTKTKTGMRKHPVYYLLSGDTVVQAENTLFRFDLSILHSKSIVLQSILPITQILHLPHFDDERPLQLFETCANDVEKLLQVLLPLPNSPLPPLTTPEHYVALLTIASKYHIPSITSFATTQLHGLPLTAMVSPSPRSSLTSSSSNQSTSLSSPLSSKPSTKSKPTITSTPVATKKPTKATPAPTPAPAPTKTPTTITTEMQTSQIPILDPLRKIAIWDQYHLDPKLLHSSYTTLIIRSQAITFQLGLTLGVKRLVQLSNAREMYRERVGCKCCGGGSVARKRRSLGVQGSGVGISTSVGVGQGMGGTGIGMGTGLGRKERWKIAEEVVDEIFYTGSGSSNVISKSGNGTTSNAKASTEKETEVIGIIKGNGSVVMKSGTLPPLSVDTKAEKKKPKVENVKMEGVVENVSTTIRMEKEKVKMGFVKPTTNMNMNTNTSSTIPSRIRTKSADSKMKLKTQSSPSSILRA